MRVPLPIIILTAGFTLSLFAAGDVIDWERARSLYQKSQRHESLTPVEQSYLDRAKALHAAMQRGPVHPPNTSIQAQTDFTPLTDLRGDYHGQDGGLYGQGRNEPPPELARAAKAETAKIVPLDASGKPSTNGKVVLLSIGMSNTTQEFSAFVQLANADSAISPKLEIVDGAQGGQSADRIASEGAPFWKVVEQRLSAANVSFSKRIRTRGTGFCGGRRTFDSNSKGFAPPPSTRSTSTYLPSILRYITAPPICRHSILPFSKRYSAWGSTRTSVEWEAVNSKFTPLSVTTRRNWVSHDSISLTRYNSFWFRLCRVGNNDRHQKSFRHRSPNQGTNYFSIFRTT